MTQELLPCPLCSSRCRWQVGSDNENSSGAQCPFCGLELWEQDEGCMERAARKWNTRPSARAVAVEELELLVIDLLACEGCGDPHNDSALGNLHAYIRRRGLGDALHEATHYPEEYDRKRKAALGGETK